MKKLAAHDWRVTTMSRIRTLIKQADPKVIEERKYKMPSNPTGIPVWYHDGMICTGETYKNHLRLTFSKGKSLKDPKGVLNRHSAIVITESDKIKESAFKALIREAVALNAKKRGSKPKAVVGTRTRK